MGKGKRRKELPRKGMEAVRFIERNAEVLEKQQEGGHVNLRVRGPKGEIKITVNVHGHKEMSKGVWHEIRNRLVQVGVLSVIIFAIVAAVFTLLS